MTDRANLGNILMGLGRISEDDVARALAHQERHGGYFGEALMAMGLVSKDELEWGLASQFDLPYIFPDADSIDPDAAELVTPEWALAHLTMPILLTADALTVVVESPIRTEAVEELAARTDRRIELALASGERIRALIRQVYSRGQTSGEPPRPTPMALDDALALALQAASERFGISVRGHRAWFWYRDGPSMRRRRLDGHWEAALDRVMSPPPSTQVAGEERKRFRAQLTREGILTETDVEFLAGPGGRELLFKPVEERSALHDRFRPPPAGVLTEIRLLARSGSARFMVRADPDLGAGLLPYLPTLLLDPSWRAVHLASGTPLHDVLQVTLPDDAEARARELEHLRTFGFDAVTTDAADLGTEYLDAVVELAAVVFLLWPETLDAERAREAGVRWELRVAGAEGAPMNWALQPLNS
jgi:type IV pilus assembly protein PilB